MLDLIKTNPKLTPFSFHVPEETLQSILKRVVNYPWHYMPEDGGWNYGTNIDYLKELCAYWVDGFDWRAQEC